MSRPRSELVTEVGVPRDWVPITPDDSADQQYRCIRANGAGTVAVKMVDGNGVTRTLNFADGETRDGYFVMVLATGTTATGLEGGV